MKVYLVFREVNSLTGTDKIAAVCSTSEKAEEAVSQIQRFRAYVKEMVVDAPVDTRDR